MDSKIIDYALPVHRALMVPDIALGIGMEALLIIISITVLLASLVSFWFVLAGAAALAIVKLLCRDDPYKFQIIINSISESDVYQV